ncbi:MAG TPA: hypothetical protein PLM79_02000 [Syntrophobacteraceae bacterium]|nr:hypothetical protein [Syntrophobacteraceae bacterium]
MKMQDVRVMAKSMGIKCFGKTKANLIREIQRTEGNFDCYGSAREHCDQEACLFRSSCLDENKEKPKK